VDAAIDGVFLDGWSLAEVPVRLALSEHALCLYDARGRELRIWSLAGLHVDAMQEGHAYHVTHASAPGEQLVLHNPELVARLLPRAGEVSALPGGQHKLAYGLALLAILALALGLLYWSAPKLAVWVARRIPLEQERALGGELEFLLQFDRCENEQARAVLTDLLRRLGQPRDVQYDVRILDVDAPNAFALPGGVILVTRGFLREASRGDEIAGVLAHEVEHIAQRHVLAGALRGALLTALWSLTLGDYSGLLVIDPSTAYRIANLEFTREDEQAADDGAVLRLHRAGLSHRGLISFFERIGKDHQDEGPAWLSTHPSSRARMSALERVPDVRSPTEPLDARQLTLLRDVCAD
jgi:beta-barrel assembly-enhancing protease